MQISPFSAHCMLIIAPGQEKNGDSLGYICNKESMATFSRFLM